MNTNNGMTKPDVMIPYADLLRVWIDCITRSRPIDPHDAVVEELAEYFSLSSDEVRRRCEQWEEESVAQWHAEDRSSITQVVEFFQTQTSWIFDTMRYHAEQCKGLAVPQSVEVMHRLRSLPKGDYLDFGAGPGSSGLFMHALGWKVSLADISTSFLEFARWRLQKHNVTATFYNTAETQLPTAAFDLITAFDVMVHIPQIRETLYDLHRALRLGGYLIFNIDSRPRGPTTEYHFFENHYPITRHVRGIGFQKRQRIGDFYVYQKVFRPSLARHGMIVWDQLRYNYYTHAVGRIVRRILP
jgi:2-polyprenyl-3-methyl-5-hydroxy-6-metoxy-1,4-benzoquinol methylase